MSEEVHGHSKSSLGCISLILALATLVFTAPCAYLAYYFNFHPPADSNGLDLGTSLVGWSALLWPAATPIAALLATAALASGIRVRRTTGNGAGIVAGIIAAGVVFCALAYSTFIVISVVAALATYH